MIQFTNLGLMVKLAYEIGLLETLTLRLFVNDYEPEATSIDTDFTEASFPGYAAVNINAWQAPGLVSDGLVRTIEQVREFTWNETGSPQDIYGYYVTNTEGTVIWAERYGLAPFELSLSDPTFVVIPRMELAQA